MVETSKKKYPAYSKLVRLRPETMKLINKLDRSRRKPNEKIFDLLSKMLPTEVEEKLNKAGDRID